jgi:Phage integrase family
MYNPNITWISADQARALVTAADADGGPQALRTAAVIRLLLHNALRVDEACAADVADLGADAGHRVLRVMRKGARKAEVPLTPATGAALDVYLNDRAQRVGPLLATATGGRLRQGHPWELVRRLALALGAVYLRSKDPSRVGLWKCSRIRPPLEGVSGDKGTDPRDEGAGPGAMRAAGVAGNSEVILDLSFPATSAPTTPPSQLPLRAYLVWPPYIARISGSSGWGQRKRSADARGVRHAMSEDLRAVVRQRGNEGAGAATR